MFSPANHAVFTLDISTLEHDFKVLAFHGHEALSHCYRFELDLISEQPEIDLDSLLHQPACLTISPGQVIHGLICAACQDEGGERLHRYQITLVPQLDYLRHCRDQRVFQHLSVPQIISRVLQAQGIPSDAFRFQLGSDYPERRYCTQYNESNLAFIERLCAEEGIHYHFQHSIDAHLLVFAD
ncbi:MAG: type VI secretion system tip protein VgrG, partial [Pseudomonadaceae bacterium]